MGLKENFNQAMKELLNKGGLVGSELKEQASAQSDLDAYLDMTSSYNNTTNTYSGGRPEAFDQDSEDISMSIADTDWQDPPGFEDHTAQPGVFSSSNYTSSNYSSTQNNEYNRLFRQAEEMTIISKSTMIVGNIKTLANITVEGNIRGNIEALKDANIQGMLIGDITCNNTNIKGSSIQGNVLTKGSTYIDNDSILLGDLTAQYANIDGKVKGNIEVGSKVELRSNAIVAGNINTNTISIEGGANIRGYVNTTFLREQGDDAFPKQVIITNDSAE